MGFWKQFFGEYFPPEYEDDLWAKGAQEEEDNKRREAEKTKRKEDEAAEDQHADESA